jgi:hypothetical protein
VVVGHVTQHLLEEREPESIEFCSMKGNRFFRGGGGSRVLIQVEQYLKVGQMLGTRVVRGQNLEK